MRKQKKGAIREHWENWEITERKSEYENEWIEVWLSESATVRARVRARTWQTETTKVREQKHECAKMWERERENIIMIILECEKVWKRESVKRKSIWEYESAKMQEFDKEKAKECEHWCINPQEMRKCDNEQ